VHRNHHTLAVSCLKAGLHVTIEKPLAITMRAGRMMLDAARRTKRILHVAENYRRTPQNRALNWVLRQGRIGRPRMIYWIDVGERLWYWSWREHRDQAGGGWTLDGGVHFADLFRYHVGEVKEIYSSVRTFFPMRYKKPQTREDAVKVDVEDTTVSVLTFANGVTGQWTSTSAAPGAGFSKRVVYGEEGSLDFNAGLKTREAELKVDELVYEFMNSIKKEEKERLFPGGVTDPVATELKEFGDCVLHGGPMETSGADQYKSLAVCFGVYESAVTHRPVKIRDIEALKVEEYQRDLNEDLGLVKKGRK
jgi:predicted dehydrogenase